MVDSTLEEIKQIYVRNKPFLERIKHKLESETIESLKEYSSEIDRIYFRVKEIDRFLEKIQKKNYSNPLVNIEDQIGGRVIVFFKDDIAFVKDKLMKTFYALEDKMVERPEDEITHTSRDDAFGYQSFHLIFKFPPEFNTMIEPYEGKFPKTFEIQIRTIFMHAYAEPQHRIAYERSEELPKEIRKNLAWIAASAWGADQEYQRVINWWLNKEDIKKS
jgi:ppGpp synthetase/RelA/SpoT-type nucleotidyltranferase